eukprot:scaffold3941_cov412-Prasinococcus_capsulatus_cf.AAC.16
MDLVVWHETFLRSSLTSRRTSTGVTRTTFNEGILRVSQVIHRPLTQTFCCSACTGTQPSVLKCMVSSSPVL